MRNFFLVLLLLLLVKANSYAQNTISLEVPRITPVSPTAAAMNKYQSYPVDHSTGVPNITIPLYEIVAGDVTIPVTLSYHASGLKPKERSGIAGTGWTLNLEPSVTRQVNGVADETPYGWFNNYNRIPGNNVGKLQYYNDVVDNKIDTQPDKFSYKLPHGGGSGYFPNSPGIGGIRNLYTLPRTNDKVTYTVDGKINITDENGVRYAFYETFEKSGYGDTKTRWMCSSIWSPRNLPEALVNFKYTTISKVMSPSTFDNLDNKVIFHSNPKGNYLIEQRTNHNYCYRISYNTIAGVSEYDAILESTTTSAAGVNYPIISRYQTDDLTIARLEEAKFMGNKLYVSYNSVGTVPNNQSIIDNIEVTDQNGKLIRKIAFFITPYNNNTSLTKLDSVRISAPGVETQTYSFQYHNIGSVPSIYTTAVDHWGFCNGAQRDANQTTVPSFHKVLWFGDTTPIKINVNYQGINREPDFNWTKTGVLTCITNPQGIQASFSYESNYGAFRDNSGYYGTKDYLHPVGGLRVKEIKTTNPKTQKSTITQYKYGLTKPDQPDFKPIWGGGAIKHIVTLRDYASVIDTKNADYKYKNWLTVISSIPESNITFNGGSAVLYNIVEEENWGMDIKDIHRTRYYYNVKLHNFEDVFKWDESSPVNSIKNFLEEQSEEIVSKVARKFPAHPHRPSDDYLDYYLSSNQLYGKLIRKELFRKDKLVSSTEYIYEKKYPTGDYIQIDVPIRTAIIDIADYTTNPLNYPDIFNSAFIIGNHYSNTEKAQTSYVLDNGTFAALGKEITKDYYYINGRTDFVTTEKKYTYDFNWQDPLSSIKPRSIETTNSDNTKIIDEFEYLVNYPAILSYHKQKKNNNWIESRILFKENTPLPQKVQSKTNQMQDFRDEVIYNAYDSHGNVTEIMGKDGTPISLIWGYRKQFPVAKIENASIQQIIDAIGFSEIYDTSAPGSDVMSKINSLRTKLPTARVTTYEYKPLQGVTAITDPNNITTKFEYDGYSRLTNSYYLDVKSQSDIRKVMLQKYIYNLGK